MNPGAMCIVVAFWLIGASEVGSEPLVRFHHWSSKTSSVELWKDDKSQPLNPAKPLFLLIDGFLSNGTTLMLLGLKNALLDHYQGAADIITVDWTLLSGFLDFKEDPTLIDNPEKLAKVYAVVAPFNVPTAAREVQEFIVAKVERNSLANVTIIGHSLGAHAAGAAGRMLINQGHGKVGNIAGLDPAGPYFDTAREVHLKRGDGEYVLMVHTDGFCKGDAVQNQLGTCGDVKGDANFHVNGGRRNQPEPPIEVNPAYSHSYSYLLYTAAVRGLKLSQCSCIFPAECRLMWIQTDCAGPKVFAFPINQAFRGHFHATTDWTPVNYHPSKHEVGFGYQTQK